MSWKTIASKVEGINREPPPIEISPYFIQFWHLDAVNQQEQITPEVISSLFWFNSIIGLALTAAFALSSQLIAALFSQPALAEIRRSWCR